MLQHQPRLVDSPLRSGYSISISSFQEIGKYRTYMSLRVASVTCFVSVLVACGLVIRGIVHDNLIADSSARRSKTIPGNRMSQCWLRKNGINPTWTYGSNPRIWNISLVGWCLCSTRVHGPVDGYGNLPQHRSDKHERYVRTVHTSVYQNLKSH